MEPTIDAAAAREARDGAADGFVAAEAAGRDRYRYAFYGPAQVALCGDETGKKLALAVDRYFERVAVEYAWTTTRRGRRTARCSS